MTPGFVYAVTAGDTGEVKIGHSSAPRDRIRNLQTARSEELSLSYLVPGAPDLERALHCRFYPLRLRGEWFLFGRRNVAEETQDFVRWFRRTNGFPMYDTAGMANADVDASVLFQLEAWPNVTPEWLSEVTGLRIRDVDASLARLADSFRAGASAGPDRVWHPYA